ncbi:hypothetical protein [Algoriphagus sp. Y33]|uniref:hypothetical protein n=1 Tax=Algoriphagus sp. Y33 TaxID=2772483 RepID=UPI00177BB9AE|nr:hypothetical protein [Algoriphagus sp. Y33]
MRTNYIPQPNQKWYKLGQTAVIFMGLAFLIGSCADEPDLPQVETIGKQDQLSEVRDWFEAHEPKLQLTDEDANARKRDKRFKLKHIEKKPDWNKSHHYTLSDGRRVWEVGLKNKEVILPSDGDTSAEKARRVIQNILFVEHPDGGRFDPLVVRYYPDGEVDSRDFRDLSYLDIDEKWSGWIDLFTYDGYHVKGYRIDAGEKVSTRVFLTEEVTSSESLRVRCELVGTDWYLVGSGGMAYLDTTYEYECEWSDGGNAGPGYYYPNDSYPGGGGGGDTSSGGSPYTPPQVGEPNLKVMLEPSFKNNPNLMCILEKLELTDFVKNLVQIDGVSFPDMNVSLRVENIGSSNLHGQADPNEVPEMVVVTINQAYIEDINTGYLSIARTILHELIHAEIMVALEMKGVSVLGKNFAEDYQIYQEKFVGKHQSHNYMADNLIPKMASVLEKIHPKLGKEAFWSNSYVQSKFGGQWSNQFYTAIAWQGLDITEAWEGLSKETRTRMEKFQIIDNKLTKDCD